MTARATFTQAELARAIRAAEARVEWRDVPDATPAPLPLTRDQ